MCSFTTVFGACEMYLYIHICIKITRRVFLMAHLVVYIAEVLQRVNEERSLMRCIGWRLDIY